MDWMNLGCRPPQCKHWCSSQGKATPYWMEIAPVNKTLYNYSTWCDYTFATHPLSTHEPRDLSKGFFLICRDQV